MAIREGLLALLANGPRHGYQLKTEFEAATGGVWPLNVGQVYTTLDRLERDNCIESNPEASTPSEGSGAAQKQFRITPNGLAELTTWWDAVPADDPPPRDELMLKILLALEKVNQHDIKANRASALGLITHQRSAMTSTLQAARKEQRTKRTFRESNGVARDLVAEILIMRAEADLRWLNSCEARLTTTTTQWGNQ